MRPKSGVGAELACPALRLGVFDHPHAAEFAGREVAALDLAFHGVARRVSLGGNLGGGEHIMTVTRLRAAAQPARLALCRATRETT